MRRLLIVGCGDVAMRALPFLVQRYRVYALLRDPGKYAAVRALGAIPLPGDLDRRATLAHIAGLVDDVMHLAPPPGSGNADTRTRNLLAALSMGRAPQRLVYVSTSGVYGDCGGEFVAETRPPQPDNPRAYRRLDAESRIRDWARRNRVQAVILRVPGIYAADRLPVERLRNGTPAILAAEDGYTNHIHADDLARVLMAALQRGKSCRVYHASDDSELKMGDYFDAVADAVGLPRPPRLSRAEVERAVSPGLWSFMCESRRLDNRRMKTELGVALMYPTVVEALAAMHS